MKLKNLQLPVLLACAALMCACGPMIDDKTVETLSYQLSIDGKVAEKTDKPVTWARKDFPLKTLFDALHGKKAGDKIKVIIPPAQAYGQVREDLIVYSPWDKENPKPGDRVKAYSPNNKDEYGLVLEVVEKAVKLDFNHPYAGKTLEYDVKILRVSRPQK